MTTEIITLASAVVAIALASKLLDKTPDREEEAELVPIPVKVRERS